MEPVASSSPATGWRKRVQHEWLLLVFAALALLLALFDPRPPDDYRRWLQLPTLAGLTGLLVAIQGIRDSGLVRHAAVTVLARAHSLRRVGLLLVASAYVLAFYPPESKRRDGQFHTIRIEGPSGLTLRQSRPGFQAEGKKQ